MSSDDMDGRRRRSNLSVYSLSLEKISMLYIVDYGFGPVTSQVFVAGGLGHVAGGLQPPWRGAGLGNGIGNWAPALAVGIGLFLLSLSYISL